MKIVFIIWLLISMIKLNSYLFNRYVVLLTIYTCFTVGGRNEKITYTWCVQKHTTFILDHALACIFSSGCLIIRIVPRDISHTTYRECVAKKSTLYHVLSFYNHLSFARWWNFYIFGLWINIMTEDLHIERYTRLFRRLAFRGFPLLQKT